MASNMLTNLRGPDQGANRQTDAISRLVEPVAKAVMATPIMGARPPAWIRMELTGGFAPSGSWAPCRYHRDALGYVHVQACLISPAGAAPGTVVFTLPVGYRPSLLLIFVAESSSAFNSLHMAANGQLSAVLAVVAGGSINFAFSFLAEQ